MSEEEVLVECSPRTYQRIQNDAAFKENLAQQVLIAGEGTSERNETQCEEQDFVPIDNDDMEDFWEDPDDFDFSSVNENTKSIWLEAPTKMMLHLVQELQKKVGKSHKFQTKKKMWMHIRDEMANAGYTFTVSQIEGKYRGLERKFKKTKNHNSQTGRDRKTCAFESEMGTILEKKRGMFPEFILGNDRSCRRQDLLMQAGLRTQEQVVEGTGASSATADEINNNELETSTETPKGRSNQSLILQELRKIREEKEHFHAKALQLMEEKSKRDVKKIQLLEKLLELKK